MSHTAYDLQLQDAINELQEQVKNEHEPTQENESGKPVLMDWPEDEVFQYLAVLYIKYIDIYRKLEECYDQNVHPQKRIFIKKVLECTICRICELKFKITQFNPRKKSIYVHLDQLLFDLKYDPSVIEIPVPRYFREDDRIELNLIFKEPVEKDGGGKKKKKPKKKKKKKKKKDDDEGEKKIPPMPLVQKQELINQLMVRFNKGDEPEIEMVQDPFTLDIDIQQAIRLIQKNDRGRQGRQRILLIFKSIQQQYLKAKLMREIKEGKVADTQQNDNKENESCVFIQRRIRGILARKFVDRLREEEMEFLGMSRKKKTPTDLLKDPLKKQDQTLQERKETQETHNERYLEALKDIQEEIAENQGRDIQQQMLKERREWVNEQKMLNQGKPPADIKDFYQRFATATPSAGEDGDEGEKDDGGGKKGKKEAKKEKGKKGKGKKGGGGDGDDKAEVIKIGPTEVVTKFEEQQEEYIENWQDRDEIENYKQQFDTKMAKTEVMPNLEKEFKEEVDNMIMVELENMKLLAGGGKKKKKGKKKGKKKKKGGKKKGLKLPGYKAIKDKKPDELLKELITFNVVKKLPPQNLTDFIGEFNYIHSMMDDIKFSPADPSMALIRQLITEYIIFPLGSELCHMRFPENIRSFLFYGPEGSGKTLVVRACATETNSVIFDMSPINIDGIYSQKKEEEKLVASVMIVAKEYQPSIIYIDECEKVWPAKKKGKKGKKGGKKKKSDPSDPKRIKKALGKWRTKFIDDKTRITILGCTSHPEEGSKKEFKKFFDKQIYFPFPDYSTRRLMWRQFMEKHGAKIRPDFPLSTLAHISDGFSAGSIKQTCEKVLTEYRVKHQDQRPLSLPEFIGPLSICKDTTKEQYEEIQEFTDFITGDKKRREALDAALNGDDGDGGGGKKKKKKGK